MPEADINAGLASNTVWVVKQDLKGTVWVGTEQGLSVMGDQNDNHAAICKAIGPNPVWTIAFYKTFAFVGTRYRGLYIFDINKGSLLQRFDSAEIGLCRRLRVIGDTVFLATRGLPFYFTLENKSWRKHRLKALIKDGFYTDFCSFNGKVYASKYESYNNRLYSLLDDSLVISADLELLVDTLQISDRNTLSLASNGSDIAVGGDGFFLGSSTSGKYAVTYLRKGRDLKIYPVWDACFIGSSSFYAIGNPDNNQEGMVFQAGKDRIEELSEHFYCQSLYPVPETMGLWIGTTNRGLFYWPSPVQSVPVKKNDFFESTYIPFSDSLGLIFNSARVAMVDWVNNSTKTVLEAKGSDPYRSVITGATRWNNTTAVLTYNSIFLIKDNGKVIKWMTYNNRLQGAATEIRRIQNKLILFSLHYDYIFEVDLNTGAVKEVKGPSTQSSTRMFKGHIFYSTLNSGFNYYDSIAHPFSNGITSSESFCIAGDTLWVLKAGQIGSYKIDLNHFELIPLTGCDYRTKIEGFFPNWIISCAGKVFTGDKKGYFELNLSNGEPTGYVYSGNYASGKPPSSDGKRLYFNYENYLTRIDPSYNTIHRAANTISAGIFPGNKLYRYSPFKLKFSSQDYFILKHSLKTVVVMRNGKVTDTLYTLSDHIEFPNGVAAGNYELKIYLNGQFVSVVHFGSDRPFTSSPAFYLLIGALGIAILILFLRSFLIKKNYERRILDNRLQLLKQNLNPHFIFNSLNLIYSLVLQKRNEAAIRTINDFSDLHRYYLDNISNQKIPLSKELAFIKSYLKMESERVEIDDPFEFTIPEDLSDRIYETEVPPMILQPIVENAVKYSSSDKGTRKIWVGVEETGEILIISIENTVGGKTIETSGIGIGLQLVQERVDIYNKAFGQKVIFRKEQRPVKCEKGFRSELHFFRATPFV